MSQQVIRTPLANEDILTIWDYIAQDNVQAADNLLLKIDETIQEISRTPGHG